MTTTLSVGRGNNVVHQGQNVVLELPTSKMNERVQLVYFNHKKSIQAFGKLEDGRTITFARHNMPQFFSLITNSEFFIRFLHDTYARIIPSSDNSSDKSFRLSIEHRLRGGMLTGESSNNTQQTLSKIVELIEIGNQVICEADQAVVVIGDSGVGKTTLLNYLSGQELTAIPGSGLEDSYIIDLIEPMQGFKIGHSVNSQTTLPNRWVSEGVVYWDCPGFWTNLGNVENIAEAFYIKKIFEKSKNVKILIATDRESLIRKVEGFTKLLSALRGLFGSFNAFKQGTSFIVTKLDGRYTSQDVCKQLQKIHIERNSCLDEEDKRILEFLMEEPERIVTFPVPTESGPISLEKKEAIFRTIQKASFFPDPQVSISITPSAMLLVNDLFNLTQLSLDTAIKDLCVLIEQKYQTWIQEEHFAVLHPLIEGIYPLLSEEIDNALNIENLQGTFTQVQLSFNDQKPLISIKDKLDNLIFFRNISLETCRPMETLFVKSVQDMISPLSSEIKIGLDKIISSRLNKDAEALKIAIDQASDYVELSILYKYHGLCEISSLDQPQNLDDLLVLNRIHKDFMQLRANLEMQPPSHLIHCIEILKILNKEASSYIQHIKPHIDGAGLLLSQKISALTEAQRIIQGTFHDKLMIHIKNIDKNISFLSVSVILENLDVLKNRISSTLSLPAVCLKDFDPKYFKAVQGIDEILNKIDFLNYPDLKVDSTTIAKLNLLHQEINNWINWYKIVVPKMYDYLSLNSPVGQFQGGVTLNNVHSFVKALPPSEQSVFTEINWDQCKIDQLNTLIERTWRSPDAQVIYIENDCETVTITGDCINLSNLRDKVIPGQTKLLKIEAFNTVRFDCDFELPGAQFIIIARRWKIEGKVVMNLSGENGRHHDLPAANGVGNTGRDGCNGDDGLSGLPGQNGGFFYGKGEEFINLDQLTIMANGENGGNGQDGGDGSEGLTGQDAPQSTTEGITRGTPGGSGGNGGAGGIGGCAGYKGSVEIVEKMLNITHKCTSSTKAGVPGENGRHGKGGAGGKNGNDWLYQRTPYQRWVPSGKDGHYTTDYTTTSRAQVNSSHASAGHTPIAFNRVDQKIPSDETRAFEQDKLVFIHHFRESIEGMFRVEQDNLVLKIQRPKLDQFAPRAGLGVIEHEK